MAEPEYGAMYLNEAGYAAGAAHLVPLAQPQVVPEDHRAEVVLFQVQGLPRDLLARLRGGELQHLAGHRGGEAVHAGDAVLDLEDGPDFPDVDFGEVRGLDFLEEDLFELAGTENGVAGHRGWVGEIVKNITYSGSQQRYRERRCVVRCA